MLSQLSYDAYEKHVDWNRTNNLRINMYSDSAVSLNLLFSVV